MGRLPLPKRTKKIKGTHQDCRDRNEPKTELGRPDAPSILNARAADLWEEVWAILEPMKAAGKADGLAVARYCNALQRYRELEAGFDIEQGRASFLWQQEYDDLMAEYKATESRTPGRKKAKRKLDYHKTISADGYAYEAATQSGLIIRGHPRYKQIMETQKLLTSLEARLGLSPTDRARLATPGEGTGPGHLGDYNKGATQ